MPDTFRNRLIQAMTANDIKAADLARKTGLSKAQISQYVNGVYEAKQIALYKLAVALNVSEPWLMGHDVPMGRLIQEKNSEETSMFEQIRLYFGKEASELMMKFVQLNEHGKQKALENIEDLTAIKKYTENEKLYHIKKVVRHGSFEEKTITDTELDEIKSLPDVNDLK